MKRLYKVAAVLGATGVAAGSFFIGTASASIPDADGKVYSCYDGKGNARIIDHASDSCLTGETAVNWPGSFTLDSYVKSAGVSQYGTLDCDSGDKLLSAYYDQSGSPSPVSGSAIRVNGSGNPVGESAPFAGTLTLICVNQ